MYRPFREFQARVAQIPSNYDPILLGRSSGSEDKEPSDDPTPVEIFSGRKTPKRRQTNFVLVENEQ